jgi:cold shock CspA family protein
MLFDDADLDRHIRSLQGTIMVPKPTRTVEMGQYRGVCRFWNQEKKYGFVVPDEPIADVPDGGIYCGWRSLEKSGINALARGDKISFDIKRGMDGRPYCVGVALLDEPGRLIGISGR